MDSNLDVIYLMSNSLQLIYASNALIIVCNVSFLYLLIYIVFILIAETIFIFTLFSNN